jgi:hypothetical protein
MSLRRMCTRLPWMGLVALALVGCRDETAAKGDTAPPAIANAKENVRQRSKIQRLSPEAMKLYRLEVCYFGGLGLRGSRDAYVASLGDKPPSKDNLPSFGVAEPEASSDATGAGKATPEPGKLAAAVPNAKPSAVASAQASGDPKAPKSLPGRLDRGREQIKDRMRQRSFRARLPYTRHIRSCTVAKKLKRPAAPDLDAVTGKFETYAIGLHKIVHEAHRYYSRKQYEEDQFKRGMELHEELNKQFGELDAQIEAFGKAYQGWREKQGAAPDKLGEGGELSEKALAKARALILLMWAKDEWDTAAIGTATESAEKALEELEGFKEKEPGSVHVRMVTPHLRRMIDAAKKAAKELEGKKLSTEVLFDATYGYVAAVDANHQALARSLNPKMRRPMDASKVKRPDIKRARPPLRRPPNPSPGENPKQ